MRGRRLRTGALAIAAALSVAGCTTSSEAPVTTDGLRGVVGTSLIGVKGATPADQAGIDETAAGLCGASIWTSSECARHGRESRD
ncbi:hypothetical protein SIN08_11265 [Chelativorans sp. M5D2P16]|nr:hypothetical protein [Chelativorans sp. M5D2P16]MDZ5697829.1 hypothetical protein [Chelativorans sp. M5D2P16]